MPTPRRRSIVNRPLFRLILISCEYILLKQVRGEKDEQTGYSGNPNDFDNFGDSNNSGDFDNFGDPNNSGDFDNSIYFDDTTDFEASRNRSKTRKTGKPAGANSTSTTGCTECKLYRPFYDACTSRPFSATHG